MKINQEYLYLFKKLKKEYVYQLSKGIYLSFDSDTLEYLGIILFYEPYDNSKVGKMEIELLNNMLSSGVIDYIV